LITLLALTRFYIGYPQFLWAKLLQMQRARG
jgi:hypothetical protein